MIGKTIGQYRVLAKLGEGGMSVVYKAEDTRLGRIVALKFLSAELSRNALSLERLNREARAASALNHPHICTIHDIVELEDQTFIVMEWLEGTNLRQRIHGQPLEVQQVIEFGIQIADALEAAHTKGMVHRDLKPENILVTKHGEVKILDFGLAKLAPEYRPIAEAVGVSAQTTLAEKLLSTPGALLGTVPYMSPEQARGEEVDARTDLFSFGVVLYDMATGELPFRGNTPAVIFHGILERDPELPVEKNPAIPEKLQDVILKALEKNREDRYQSAREMLVDLRRLKKSMTRTPSGSMQPASVMASGMRTMPPSSARLPSKVVAAGAGVVLAAIAGIYLWTHRKLPAVAHPFERISLRSLTDSGRASQPAISPDGKYVAYVDESAGAPALALQQVGGGGSIQIAPPEDAEYGGLIFSPDGNSLYFARFPRNSPKFGDLYVTPVLGGKPRLVVSDVVSPPGLSPDGRRMAYIRRDIKQSVTLLMMANTDGTGESVLVDRPLSQGGFVAGYGGRAAAPAWSPDGKTIAVGARVAHAGLWNLVGALVVTVNVADGKTSEFDLKGRSVGRLVWLPDSSELLVTGWDSTTHDLRGQIWLLALASGEVRRITEDLSNYAMSDLSVTADGSVIAGAVQEDLAHLWIAPHGDMNRATQITSGNRSWKNGLAWLPDGRIVAADSDFNLAILNRDGSAPQQLVLDSHPQWGPAVCGQAIAFIRLKSIEEAELWRVDLEGGHPRRLLGGRLGYPTCTPDGEWIALNAPDASNRPSLNKISSETGERISILLRRAFPSAVSPDGREVAMVIEDSKPEPARNLAVMPLAGGEPKIVARNIEFGPSTLRWTPDGKAVTYSLLRKGVANIWRRPVNGGPATQITNFKSDVIFDFCWAPSGDLLIARGPVTRNVVLIRNASH